MMFDRKKPHGFVSGIPGVAYEQDGKLYNARMEPVAIIPIDEETLASAFAAIPDVLDSNVVVASEKPPIPEPTGTPAEAKETPRPPQRPKSRAKTTKAWRKKTS